MKTVRTHHFFLALILFLTICLFAAGIYTLVWYIPAQSLKLFGPPAPEWSHLYQIIYAARLYINKDVLFETRGIDPSPSLFVIQQNESVSSIANRLSSSELIGNSDIWLDYLIYTGIDRKIQSGTYLLGQDMSPIEIAALIHDDNPDDVTFAFLPGWRSEEIAALIPDSGLAVDMEELLELISNPGAAQSEFIQGSKSLEGFLYPDSYQLDRTINTEEFLIQLLDQFFNHLPNDYIELVNQNNLNLHEAVVLASIIQRETVLPEEAPIIASVFINRLKAGMPLQSDPTVQYALGFDENNGSWWKPDLTQDDLQIESPFNTYIHAGLPPSAISNPDIHSLMAVAHPADTPYYYFRSECDHSGRHIFSETYDAHLQAACDQ